jgi:hypothetical protein
MVGHFTYQMNVKKSMFFQKVRLIKPPSLFARGEPLAAAN